MNKRNLYQESQSRGTGMRSARIISYPPEHEVYDFTQPGIQFRVQQQMLSVSWRYQWLDIGVFASMPEASRAAGPEGRVITELAE